MSNVDRKIRFGFIGYGKFSQVRERYLIDNDNVELIGFYDPYQNSIFDIQKYTNINIFLDACDAVIISVPPKLAPDYVCQALNKNKSVFCEKPAAACAEDLVKIENYLKPSSLLAYGFNHRQHPSIVKIKETIDQGSLGSVLWMRGRYGKEVDENYVKTWRCNVSLNGGGILIDQGIHLVDLMSYLSGGFNGVQALLSNHYLGIKGIDDNGFITLYSTQSKISASLHSTVTQWRYLFSLEIFLEKGSMVLNGLRTNSGKYGEEVLSIKPNSAYEAEMGILEIKYSENISWKKEVSAFVESVRTGSTYPYAKYEDALKTTKLIDLIYKKAVWV
jgi:1,5-anhydro-D-fructose reductase (1,5-anhydro-D-mannitol-forming)